MREKKGEEGGGRETVKGIRGALDGKGGVGGGEERRQKEATEKW